MAASSSPADPHPFRASDHSGDHKHHILLAASGSVATIKLPQIAQGIAAEKQVSIRIIVTQSAARFLQGQSPEQPPLQSLLQIPGVDGIYQDEDEWNPVWTRDAPILHIELRSWADMMLIAPLSANTLAKMVAGFTDSLLLSVVRAWDRTLTAFPDGDVTRREILVAPAMNVHMWNHPVTRKHIAVLEEEWGDHLEDGWIRLIEPIEKRQACGDEGVGAMAEWTDIVAVAQAWIRGSGLQHVRRIH